MPGEAKLSLGHAGVTASLALSSLPTPPPHFINLSLFLEIKKIQINNTNSSTLMKESFLLQNKQPRACWRLNSVAAPGWGRGGERGSGFAGCLSRGGTPTPTQPGLMLELLPC